MEFVQGIVQQIGEYSGTVFLGFLNPAMIATTIFPSIIVMIKRKTATEVLDDAGDIAKKPVSTEFCGKISENSTRLVESTIGIV